MRVLNTRFCLLYITKKMGIRRFILILCVVLLIITVQRKYIISSSALRFLNSYSHQINPLLLDADRELYQLIKGAIIPPAVLFSNQYALNITLNWLCNIQSFNIGRRLVIIALDEITYDVLRVSWPDVKTIRWKVPSMEGHFTVGSGPYQMFQLFRANLISYLIDTGKDFWMLQADTYWRTDLFAIFDPATEEGEILFDKEGDSGLSGEMVAGGNFYIRSTEKTKNYFKQLSTMLRYMYATDNNIMGTLCAIGFGDLYCGEIPYRIIGNWRWHLGLRTDIPPLLQFDFLGGGKFERMMRIRLRFSTPNGTCLNNSYDPGTAVTLQDLRQFQLPSSLSLRLIVWGQTISEYLCKWSPDMSTLLRTYLIPNFAYYLIV